MTLLDDRSDLLHGTQGACFWAARHLVSESDRITGQRLPLLTWVISADEPKLHGLAATEAYVRQWAAHLGLPVTELPPDHAAHFEACGFTHGIPIRVWSARPATRPSTEV